jgi:5-hydroxyisourate hydrolase
MSVSTHVLDARTGRPAPGMGITLRTSTDLELLDAGRTDADGRLADLNAPAAGRYQLVFDTGHYFAELGVETFYPEVCVSFEVIDPAARCHVPLLLSPFAYSTYRGS